MEVTEGVLLRIFISEDDRREGKPLAHWIVSKALEIGISGATVFRAIEGYGRHSQIHTTHIIDLSNDLPLILEIVDTKDNIDRLLAVLDEILDEGIATTEKVLLRKYRSRGSKKT